MSVRCVIIGGGGHARVVIEALRREGRAEPSAIVDPDTTKHGGTLDGVDVVGGDASLPGLLASGVTHFVMGYCGRDQNTVRERLFEAARGSGFAPFTLVHPDASVASNAVIGEGGQVHVRAVVNPGACTGVNSVVNSAAVVEHDCVVGDHVHVASAACLAGGVRVGAGAYIGAGSVVRQGIDIGAGALVAAGAVVVRDVPAGATVAGVPAKPIPRP